MQGKMALGPWKGTEQSGGRTDDLIQLCNLFTPLHCSSSAANKQRKAGHSSPVGIYIDKL